MEFSADSDSDSTTFSEGGRFSDLESDGMQDSDTSDTEEENIPSLSNNWNMNFVVNVEPFTPSPNFEGVLEDVTINTTPLKILQKMLSDKMLESICAESLIYANQKPIPNYKRVDVPELWRFFAINFAMGLDRRTAMKDYWSKKSLVNTPFFANTMSRDRYLQILRSIHFHDNNLILPQNKDRFIKLGTFMSDLLESFKQLVNPGEYLCLDESMVPFKGRLSIKQYNPMKRSRFGVKLFILADCSSKLILDVLPYQGANTQMKFPNLIRHLGFGGATVMSLLEPFYNKGHKIVIDNWFNSPTLATMLKNKNTYVLGTVQKRRKGMPSGDRVTRKLQKGGVELFSNGEILIKRWSDRRDVYMLNSFLEHGMIESRCQNPNNTRAKPKSVILYNLKMGAVDDSDRIIRPYRATRKTFKWYRKVAFHLIDLAVYNSFVIYCGKQGKKLPYKEYLELLIGDILREFPKQPAFKRKSSGLVRDQERLTGLHLPRKLNTRSNCSYCQIVLGKRSQTKFECIQCKKRLCIEEGESCFALFHTEVRLKKARLENQPASMSLTSTSVSTSPPSTQSPSLLENNLDFVFP